MTMLLSLNTIQEVLISPRHRHQLTTKNQPRRSNHNNDDKLLDEDDTSTSSTIPVDQRKKVEGMHQDSGPTSNSGRNSEESSSPASSSGRKVVRFGLDGNVAHDSLFADKDEAAELLWYNDADYQRFRSESHAIAREAASADRKNGSRYSYAQVVLRTYRACCSYYEQQQRQARADDDNNNDHHDDDDDTVLSQAQRRVLERTLEGAATDRLGLELKSMRHLRKEVRNRRTDLYDFVLDLQTIPVRGNPHRRAEYIRRGCECVSLPSRIFAQTMAQAQLAACSSTTTSGSTHDDYDEAELMSGVVRLQQHAQQA